LQQEKGYVSKKFIEEFPNRNWSLSFLRKKKTAIKLVHNKAAVQPGPLRPQTSTALIQYD